MWWNAKQLGRIDWRAFLITLLLMGIGVLIVSSHTGTEDDIFFTATAKTQLRWCVLSLVVYFFFAGFDYHRLREWSWILYGLMIVSLAGLFLTDPIQRVHRWYRLPFLGMSLQPSEYAKLVVVISLSWFLERRRDRSYELSTTLLASVIVGVPFLLILKQPDLGSALVLMPITWVMFYYGDLNQTIVRMMSWVGGVVLILTALIFLGVIPHESLRPYATLVMKEYQFDRFNPATHHQWAAATAIAIGGWSGFGWRGGEFTSGGWLPASYTDSVFPAFGEEFGFFGMFFLLVLFYSLIYCCFQVTAVAKDHFGRLLSAGISIYLAMHVLVNIGMMCGLLPITGVPLLLVTYGGSSILFTMTALGILQSIYSRRYMFYN